MGVTGPITMDQKGCARCGAEGHSQITYLPLERPMVIDDICGKVVPGRFTHWALCPVTEEPIMLYVVDTSDVVT